MALKTIETRAIISASDETGSVFSRVVEKIRNLEAKAESATKKLRATTKAAETAKAATPKAERASGIAAGLRSTVTAIIAAESVRALADAIGARVHEAVRMETAGMSPAEIEQAKTATAKLSTKFPSIGQTEWMQSYRTARSIIGSTEEAKSALETIAPLRVIMGTKHGAAEDMDLLLKSMEIEGVTQDKKKMQFYVDQIAKALSAFPESTLKPVQYYEFAKYGRQATAGLSPEYTTAIAPTVSQEMGGMSAGQATASFNRAIVGGIMSHPALKNLAALGLIKDEDLEKTTTGSIKGLIPGRHIKGYELAQSNPFEWVRQVMLPAFAEHGITKKEDILAKISEVFSKQTAAQLVGIFATQAGRIEKDMALIRAAMPAEQAAKTIMDKDLNTQLEGVKNSATNLATTLGTGLMGNSGALNAVSTQLGILNERLTNVREGSGQQKFNRFMDTIFDTKKQGSKVGIVPGKSSMIAVPSVGPVKAGANVIPSAIQGNAEALITVKNDAEKAREVFAKTSWRHPLDKLEAQRVLGDAMQKELEAEEKFEASRPPAVRGAHAGQRHLLGAIGGPGAIPATRLEGAATIKNSLSIALDPGLIAKEIRSQLDAGGNLRADTGVSMPR